MAKKSMIARDVKRVQVAKQFAVKRARLRAIIADRNTDPEAMDAAQLDLQKLPRDAGPTRQQRRCRITGRPHSVYRKFGLGRNKLREVVMRGDAPGVVKASW